MLAAQPALQVTTVAYDCGFSSSQYFDTCFKRRFGISPLDVRRQPQLLAG
jgi:AraC family L-rhamnose operon regulatory protein RhaS